MADPGHERNRVAEPPQRHAETRMGGVGGPWTGTGVLTPLRPVQRLSEGPGARGTPGPSCGRRGITGGGGTVNGGGLAPRGPGRNRTSTCFDLVRRSTLSSAHAEAASECPGLTWPGIKPTTGGGTSRQVYRHTRRAGVLRGAPDWTNGAPMRRACQSKPSAARIWRKIAAYSAGYRLINSWAALRLARSTLVCRSRTDGLRAR